MIVIKIIVGIIAALFFIYWAIRIVAVILAIINIHDGFPDAGKLEMFPPEEYEEIKDEMKKRGFGRKRLEELRRERMKKKEQQ